MRSNSHNPYLVQSLHGIFALSLRVLKAPLNVTDAGGLGIRFLSHPMRQIIKTTRKNKEKNE
jgi:hypothetical protein